MVCPKFTVVTPSLNCGAYILRNINSVQSQAIAPNLIEHWVIDGGSTDDTVDILKQHPSVKYISERDRGLSHAVNKGLERARGDWIIWLNADDELAPNALQLFIESQSQWPEIRIFVGQQRVFGYDGTFEQMNVWWEYDFEGLLGGRMAIAQASTFVHRSVYESVGLMDESYRYAMDYEWIVRAAHHFVCHPVPFVLTHYHRRSGSIMDRGIYRQHQEVLRVRRKYHRSYWELAEWRIRFYLLTEPLRRLSRLRRLVRKAKTLIGVNPSHPIPNSVR